MVNKEEILKDILLKMNYDSSKTLNENIQEQEFYIPQSDNTRVDPSYLGLTSDGKPISMLPQGEKLTKPTPPEQGQIFSQAGKPIDYSSVPFFATYYSPRLEKLKCRGYGPSSTKVSSKIPNNQPKLKSKKMCLGKDGQKKLISVYRQDLKDWELDSSPISSFIYEYRHGLLDALAIATLFIPLVGPVISLGLEAGNAALYYKEGDNYSAGLAAAFALIPLGGILRRIPGVKKYGRDFLVTALKRARIIEQGGKLSKPLTKLEKEAVEAYSKNSKEIMRVAKNEAKKKGLSVTAKNAISTQIKKVTKLVKDDFSEVIYRIYKYAKKHPKKFNLAKTGLEIAGVWYSWDKIAEIYGITDKDKSTGTQSSEDEEKMVTITDHDKTWDYRKDGDKYYTKKKDSDKWILTSGKAEDAIKTKVFGSEYKKIMLTPEMKKIEQEVQKNPHKVAKQLIEALIPDGIDEDEMEKMANEIFGDL